MWCVYIIRSSATDRYYIGSTNNFDRRLKEHNRNKTRSLKNKGPFHLVHREDYSTVSEARKREEQIKRYKGGNAFKKLVNAPD